jgi:hypothetical protein
VVQTEKDAKHFSRSMEWLTPTNDMVWENIPLRGWDLENDTITKTVGRKTILNKYKNKFHYFEIKLEIYLFKYYNSEWIWSVENNNSAN